MVLGDKVNEFQNQVAGFANCCTLFNAEVQYVGNELSARIFKLVRSPRIDQGTNSARLCLAGYGNPIPARFLAPIDCLKIPAQDCCTVRGLIHISSS